MTLRECLHQAVQSLSNEDAESDARYLFLAAFEMTFETYLMNQDAEADPEKVNRLNQMIEQRKQSKPVAYILGQWEFMGFVMKTTPAVLVPRADTEVAASKAIQLASQYLQQQSSISVLDLCTGSGCIAISIEQTLATRFSEKKINVTASDISTEALLVAEENCCLNKARVHLVRSDLFSEFIKAPEKKEDKAQANNQTAGNEVFDLIVSNPPYIATKVCHELDTDVRDYEPMLALDGGEDGLDLYRRIIIEAPKVLKIGGKLVMEIGDDQGKALEELIKNSEELGHFQLLKDLEDRDRVVICERIEHV